MADATVGFVFRGGDFAVNEFHTSNGVVGTTNREWVAYRDYHIAFANITSGLGRIIGQVRLLGQPYRGRCSIEFSPTWAPGMCIALLDTDENGYFTLYGIDEKHRYLVTAFPRDGDYNERGWSYVTPKVD